MKKNFKYKLKENCLVLLKFLGIFAISKYLTRNYLRILCYHGAAVSDEHEFNGLLFMREGTFRERILYLKQFGFTVLPLTTALEKLETNSLPPYSTVITFDDGWHHTFISTIPIVKEFNFPITIYVTSYYAAVEVCVLNVVVRYLIWKLGERIVDLRKFFPFEEGPITLHPGNKKYILDKILKYIDSLPTLAERKIAIEKFAELLGFGADVVVNGKAFCLMTKQEIYQAATDGVDVQLHTHRHRFPADNVKALEDEIIRNREFLEPLVGKRLVHLCYPSGVYSTQAFDTLQQLGIASAVTCEPGFITPKTNRLALPRFLDGENISAIEFEAELCGVLELLRRFRSLAKCYSHYLSAL